MKSPWKFLLDLASRGRTAQPSEPAPGIDTEHPAASSTAIDTAAAPASAVQAKQIDTANGPGGEVFPAIETASDDRRPDTAMNEVSAVEPVKPTRRKSFARQARGKKSSVDNVAASTKVEYEATKSDVPVPPVTFADEVSALDEDIKQLRRQLADKLSLQNAQLKKMLERF
ncbi:hypothetical protein ACIQUG_21310 [Ensifer sp. NPDC090286]|uniref:hypothetical protein n=1 Tax=Ensifer sp. NPDC090286 TaxID=3363991 RepID=UPI00383B7EF6